ncbi:MAG: FimV/HubP family polar landmark protein [Acidovorax sp.]
MHRWKHSALAAAALVTAGFYAADANALALGRINVQSALGEPLRADIELPQITPAEADSLQASVASPDAFRAQGMEYSPALQGVRVALQRRADGSAVLRLTSSRPVNEPFVDLVLNASWSTGQIVRSYTMLFDPPTSRQAPPAATVAPQVSAAPSLSDILDKAEATPATPATPAPTQPQRRITTRIAPPPAAPAPAPAADTGSVKVRPGDTAGRVAGAHRPAGVSLDQMLVALTRANPSAFVDGNVNRLRAGAVLQLPSESQAQAVSAGQARQIVAAQARDFNEFRRKLAGVAPSADVGTSGRAASGKVQAQVEDKRPAATTPDKLTLSKGAIQGQKTADDKLAQDKQASENSARMAELSRNISELNQIKAASSPAAAGGATPAASAPGVPVATTASAPASAPAEPASLPAPAASEAAPAAPVASAAAPAAKPKPVAPPPPPIEEPSFFSTLMDDPMMPLAGGGLLALLLGYGAYRVVQRRRNAAAGDADSSFMESKLQPDSFFGASGGQHVDTAASSLTGSPSSMAYSPSQLDASGDVDPVAEADVYLAYGRDLQAEEILKEAARHTPQRTAVHAKLADIYAKRQDRKALEAVANDLLPLTQGQGPDWEHVATLGREIDPDNALYQPGAHPPGTATVAAAAGLGALGALGAASALADAPAPAEPPPAPPSALPPDLDLDLDLDLPDDALSEAPPAAAPATPGGFAAALAAAAEPAPAPVAAPEPVEPAATPAAEPPLELDALELPSLPDDKPDAKAPAEPPPPAAAPAPAAEDGLQMPALDFAIGDLDPAPTAPAPLEPKPSSEPKPEPAAPKEDSSLMDFDLSGLSLDLGPSADSPAPATPAASAEEPGDALSTKLALAEEFHAIGDSDGARTLIEEVIEEASGPLKERAQKLLASLG